ncbi:MAG TPA: polysaccharide deacetylase family protein [Nitrososphaeraceae archaeon]|nr:polysaccharide deacetylase family protein [Nitrososphaeraceae archaeon]
MERTYSSVVITVATVLFTIILYPLLLYTLAYGQQQQDLFPFSYPTITITSSTKNQTSSSSSNNIHGELTNHHSFSDYSRKAENSNAKVNDNYNPDADDNVVDANNPSSGNSGSNNNTTPKAVILNFYDNDIGQFTNAKPILDKFGFKGTFFIVCSWASSDNPDRMTWNEIAQLYREGHDIESHSTSHKVLSKLSAVDLDYQVGQSKKCIHEHLGVEPTVFSPPHNRGWNNATAIRSIAKYYDLSIGGFVTDLMFLHCYGWKHDQQHSTIQTDCRTYSNDGTLNYANRYAMKEVSHNGLDTRYSHDDAQIFQKFVQLINNQANFNKEGKINAIPIIGYHNIEDDKAITSTDVNLFYKEMKYLHDNGIKVLTMANLGYDEGSNHLYVKDGNR